MFTVAAGPEEPKQPRAGTVKAPKQKRGVKGFFADVGREMRKVTWPTKPETTRLTGVVMIVCIILVTILSVLGFVFDHVVRLVTRGHL
jgi:preprotein translocase SecE subunit